jgi:hypothetical protein
MERQLVSATKHDACLLSRREWDTKGGEKVPPGCVPKWIFPPRNPIRKLPDKVERWSFLSLSPRNPISRRTPSILICYWALECAKIFILFCAIKLSALSGTKRIFQCALVDYSSYPRANSGARAINKFALSPWRETFGCSLINIWVGWRHHERETVSPARKLVWIVISWCALEMLASEVKLPNFVACYLANCCCAPDCGARAVMEDLCHDIEPPVQLKRIHQSVRALLIYDDALSWLKVLRTQPPLSPSPSRYLSRIEAKYLSNT